jgi:AcrR family transcriptional regulator
MPATRSPDPRPERLPRGRHGLSREEVANSQRLRLMRAMAEVMAEKGYAGAPVADVLRAAGVSRESFYQHFSSKQDCFMSAYEIGVDLLLASIAGAVPDQGTPSERFEQAIGAYL